MARISTYRTLYWIGYVCWITGFLLIFAFTVPLLIKMAGGVVLAVGVIVGWQARRMHKMQPELTINRAVREPATFHPIRSKWIVVWIIGVLLSLCAASAVIMLGHFNDSVNTGIALASTLVIAAPAWYLLRRHTYADRGARTPEKWEERRSKSRLR